MTDAAPVLPAPISLAQWRKTIAPYRDRHEEVKQNLSPLTRCAVWITRHVGSMGFFLIILTWTVLWLSWNFLAPKRLVFDPPMAFVFWLFISNMIQILLMPLIMVGQNILSAQSDARAEHDLDVNVKAEQEIEVILGHLEYQNGLLLRMMQALKLDVEGAKAPAPPAKAAAAPKRRSRPSRG
jgi:uncharacterized membrane protein